MEFMQQHHRRKRHVVQLQTPGFNAGQVQGIVHQLHQVQPRAAQAVGPCTLRLR